MKGSRSRRSIWDDEEARLEGLYPFGKGGRAPSDYRVSALAPALAQRSRSRIRRPCLPAGWQAEAGISVAGQGNGKPAGPEKLPVLPLLAFPVADQQVTPFLRP